MMDRPTRKHPTCNLGDCRQCLDDHMALADYLGQQCGFDPGAMDMLGEYRTWLDKNGHESEGADGWAMPSAFSEERTAQFIDHMKGQP